MYILATFAPNMRAGAMQYVRDRYPEVPVMYYANGGSSYLDLQVDLVPFASKFSARYSLFVDHNLLSPSTSVHTTTTHTKSISIISLSPTLQRDMQCDVISLDWACDMRKARQTLGEQRLVQGEIYLK